MILVQNEHQPQEVRGKNDDLIESPVTGHKWSVSEVDPRADHDDAVAGIIRRMTRDATEVEVIDVGHGVAKNRMIEGIDEIRAQKVIVSFSHLLFTELTRSSAGSFL